MNTDAWGHPGTLDGNPGHTSIQEHEDSRGRQRAESSLKLKS